MDQNKPTIKNLQINGFRSFLLLAVILYHFLIVFSKENIDGFHIEYNFIPGQAATCVFLVLSGWFLSIRTIGSFWYKKLFKIILPFTIAIFTILIVRMSFGAFRISALDIGMNVLIFPLNSNLFTYIDGAHWYIAVLIYFFIVHTCVFLFEKAFKREISFWFYLALLFLCLLVSLFIPPSNTFFKILRCIFPSHFVFIIFGLLLSKISKNPFKNKILNIFMIVILSIVSILICFFCFDWYQAIFYVALLVLLVLCNFHLLKLLEFKVFQIIGDASLWMYLLHQEIGYIIIKPFFQNSLYWLGILVALVSMVTLGIFLSFIWKKFVLNKALQNK